MAAAVRGQNADTVIFLLAEIPIQDIVSSFLEDDLYLIFLCRSCRLGRALTPRVRRFCLGWEHGAWRYRQVRQLERW